MTSTDHFSLPGLGSRLLRRAIGFRRQAVAYRLPVWHAALNVSHT